MGKSAEMGCGWAEVPGARLYWEASGNPLGVPVLFLHGGPGASLGKGGYRKRHDPSQFWTIGLDQRGSGRSTPAVQDDLGHFSANTTQTLIEDIEAVRRHLGIEKWIVTVSPGAAPLHWHVPCNIPAAFWESPWRRLQHPAVKRSSGSQRAWEGSSRNFGFVEFQAPVEDKRP